MIASLLLAVALAAPAATAQATPGEAAPAPTKSAAPRPAGPKPAPTKAAPTAPEAKTKPSSAKAARVGSDRPVRVDADEVRFNWKTRQVTMVGKPLVTLVHDDATLTCRRLIGDNDAAGRLKTAVCEGDVRLVRAERLVTCERATYDRDAARVVCTGNPVVHDPGGTEARATTLTYDLAADEVRLEGAAQVTVPGDQLEDGAKALRPPGAHP